MRRFQGGRAGGNQPAGEIDFSGRRREETIAVSLGDDSEYRLNLLYLRYIMLHCSPFRPVSIRRRGERWFYGKHEADDDQAVLGNDG